MEPLLVDTVYFYPKENAQAHHTSKYEAVHDESASTTIVRRGQPFNACIRFDRTFEPGYDVVRLIFTLGDSPEEATRGDVTIESDAVPNKDSWTAYFNNINDVDLCFEVSTPVTLPVGNWALQVVTGTVDSDAYQVYTFNQDLYILFNPWNPDDQTFMEDSTLLNEYVLNDIGKIWMGPVGKQNGAPWVYGQFDGVVLAACMFMLDVSGIPFHERGDPVQMTRTISKIVNSQDDNGVLTGRWDGEYDDGNAPSYWAGSVDILEEYLKSQNSVRYGQCWVFSGVTTTVCRALGIPARSVTNIVSAHDANRTLTVDKYYTTDMEEIPYDPTNPQGSDSVWNFHVWNDVWMIRPDLPAGFGGWQAIDATPQEQSSGIYQCGPAPLEAIKQGVLDMDYDVDFVLASVNADMMRWRHDPEADEGFAVVETNNYHIGRMIITKKPYVFDPIGDDDYEDITDQYKYKEGTASERVALMNGVRHSERAKRYYSAAEEMNNDITFKLHDVDYVLIGQPFRIAVTIKNNAPEDRNIKIILSATSIFYNGVIADTVKKLEGNVVLEADQDGEFFIEVSADEYLLKLVEYSNMKIACMAYALETKQSWADDDDFKVLKPKIAIQLDDDLMVGEPATARLYFHNPLTQSLTDCEFRLTSTGMAGRTTITGVDDAEPEGLVCVEIPVQPNKAGDVHFVATFRSRELREISGAITANVLEG